jgi:putative FmdB family regulatory protein
MEVLRKISDEPLTECPACGKNELKKKVTAAAFRLKGGGWYETDFKTGDKKNLAGDKSGGSSSTASESKSESKSEGKSTSSKPDSGSKSSNTAAS